IVGFVLMGVIVVILKVAACRVISLAPEVVDFLAGAYPGHLCVDPVYDVSTRGDRGERFPMSLLGHPAGLDRIGEQGAIRLRVIARRVLVEPVPFGLAVVAALIAGASGRNFMI